VAFRFRKDYNFAKVVFMPQRSPIMRFALEVFEHALENYVGGGPKKRKMTVLNLAQVVELAAKAVLVEANEPIFEKNRHTISAHEAFQRLAQVWNLARLPTLARLELLIDERNTIQHRYGPVDDVTLDYHMQTVFDTLDNLLRRGFDAELQQWIKDNVSKDIWQKIRFVRQAEDLTRTPSAAALNDVSPTVAFIAGFSQFEREVLARMRSGPTTTGRASSLDVLLKAFANLAESPQALIKALPEVYRLRNRVIHGEHEATKEAVQKAVTTMDHALKALAEVPEELWRRALCASMKGTRGTTLPAEEISSLDPCEPGDGSVQPPPVKPAEPEQE